MATNLSQGPLCTYGKYGHIKTWLQSVNCVWIDLLKYGQVFWLSFCLRWRLSDKETRVTTVLDIFSWPFPTHSEAQGNLFLSCTGVFFFQRLVSYLDAKCTLWHGPPSAKNHKALCPVHHVVMNRVCITLFRFSCKKKKEMPLWLGLGKKISLGTDTMWWSLVKHQGYYI